METAILYSGENKGEIIQLSGDYRQIQELVGGCFEIAANIFELPEDIYVYVNENGIAENLPYNRGYHGDFVIAKDGGLSEIEILEIFTIVDSFVPYRFKDRYLQTFFNEKNLSTVVFTYERGSNIIQVTNHDVVRHMSELPKEMLEKSKEIIRGLDCRNVDVNHFLKHLGNAVADRV